MGLFVYALKISYLCNRLYQVVIRIMKQLLLFISMILLTISCEKIDPFVETDEGKNVLGFYLDGKKVSYQTSGGFPSEYPYEHCVYTNHFNTDSLEIIALLDNYYYNEISIKIAISEISTTHEITDPDITLTYIYRVTPLPPDEYSEGGGRIERAYTMFKSGALSFRKWDQQAGILSGNFRFDCEAPQYDGSVKSVSVSGGNFDVKTGNIL